METRANYMLVGGFALVTLVGAFVFALWLAKTTFDKRFATFDIYFAGSVAGLKSGGDVLYNGIRVGEVRAIRLAPRDPSRVLVRIEVDAATPVGEDTVASLELQGLTGVAAIQLSGGTETSAALPVMPGEAYPVIRSKRSTLDELIQGVPGLIAKATDLMGKLELVVSDDNRASVRSFLRNVDRISGQLADPREGVGRLVSVTGDAAIEFKATASRLNKLTDKLTEVAAHADSAVAEDLQPLIRDSRATMRSIQSLVDGLDRTVGAAGPGIAAFSDQGLPQITAAAADLRQLSQTLDRVLRRFESDPARFLLGDPKTGYQPK